jgi:hypothetical protein
MRPVLPLLSFSSAALLLVLAGCAGSGGNSEPVDTDGDGLTDAFEMEISSSDPLVADSDGDGFADGDEYLSFFDPTDGDDYPYAGEYPRLPLPKPLAKSIGPTGWEQGDISDDWTGTDQYGESVSLHKFYGNVVLIEVAADW